MCPEVVHTGKRSNDTTYERKVLWGITSFGTVAEDDTIGIYVKVFEQMDWIKEKIDKDKSQQLKCNTKKVFCAAQRPT